MFIVACYEDPPPPHPPPLCLGCTPFSNLALPLSPFQHFFTLFPWLIV